MFVELPKFKAKSFAEKKMQALWLRFLTEIDEHTKKADKGGVKIFHKSGRDARPPLAI